MKKFIAIIAAIAMIATMSVSVFAAAGNLNDSNATTGLTQNVSATYVESTGKASDEIHIDVTWTDVAFEFEAADQYWDEDATAWKDDVDGGEWSDDTAIVNVATRSSKGVTVTVGYTEDAVAATFDETSAILVAADADEGLKAATFTLTVDADPAQTIAEDATAGSIKVTVA